MSKRDRSAGAIRDAAQTFVSISLRCRRSLQRDRPRILLGSQLPWHQISPGRCPNTRRIASCCSPQRRRLRRHVKRRQKADESAPLAPMNATRNQGCSDLALCVWPHKDWRVVRLPRSITSAPQSAHFVWQPRASNCAYRGGLQSPVLQVATWRPGETFWMSVMSAPPM